MINFDRGRVSGESFGGNFVEKVSFEFSYLPASKKDFGRTSIGQRSESENIMIYYVAY